MYRRPSLRLLDGVVSYSNADFSVRRSNTQHGTEKLTHTAENTIECFRIDYCGDFGRGQSAVEAEEVCGETGNVRSSHGSSVYGAPVNIWAPRVNVTSTWDNGKTNTIIGEPGLRVIDIRSGDGDHSLTAGRSDVHRVSWGLRRR